MNSEKAIIAAHKLVCLGFFSSLTLAINYLANNPSELTMQLIESLNKTERMPVLANGTWINEPSIGPDGKPQETGTKKRES